jgi:YVTN family beta-propeller protein
VTSSNPSDSFRNNVSVIDTTTNKVTATISLGGVFPTAIAISPDGKLAYLTSSRIGDLSAGALLTIDTATNRVVSILCCSEDSAFLFGVAPAPDGKRVYVSAEQAREMPGVVLVFGDERANVEVGGQPRGIAVSPDGKRVYVTQGAGILGSCGCVSVIDTGHNSVVATVPTGLVSTIAIAPNGKRAYVSNGSVIDTAANQV